MTAALEPIPDGQAGLVLAVGVQLGHYVTHGDRTSELKNVYRLTQDGYRLDEPDWSIVEGWLEIEQ